MIVCEDLHIRAAELGDSRDVWTWRNDADARSASRETAPVPWDVHEAWFARALAEPTKTLLIGIDPETRDKVGLVRLDLLESGQRLVGVNVAPAWRGRGYGALLLKKALERQDGALVAEVRPDNKASIRLFERLGFRRRPTPSGGFLVFEREA